MDDTPLQLTLRELRGHLGDIRALATMAVVGVVLGFAGPFGTFESLPAAARIGYWVATVFVTYIMGFGVSKLVDRLWGEGRPMWMRVPLMIVPAALVATALVGLLNLLVFGPREFSLEALAVLLLQCLAVSWAVVIVSLLTDREPSTASFAQAVAPAPPPAILDRVPPGQRGALVALVVEDHYVEIVTARGKTLVLMRLADAIRETAPVAGLQIHRSHWVARDAVVRAHRADGKVFLDLSNGMRLPVSRGYLPVAREAGLL
ncbi:MAG TPA: LytTR family DNA-binding domain-containing protein [Devosia sp.]|nr:LytTR family DNA-binding domain-containing protein [Devosia sp.]